MLQKNALPTKLCRLGYLNNLTRIFNILQTPLNARFSMHDIINVINNNIIYDYNNIIYDTNDDVVNQMTFLF